MKKYKRYRDYGFWDQDFRLSKLSKLGDPLECLNEGVDFETFRSLLEGVTLPISMPVQYVIYYKRYESQMLIKFQLLLCWTMLDIKNVIW